MSFSDRQNSVKGKPPKWLGLRPAIQNLRFRRQRQITEDEFPRIDPVIRIVRSNRRRTGNEFRPLQDVNVAGEPSDVEPIRHREIKQGNESHTGEHQTAGQNADKGEGESRHEAGHGESP